MTQKATLETLDKKITFYQEINRELLFLKARVDRMEGWIAKIAKKVNIKLKDI